MPATLIAIALALTALAGPLLLALAGVLRSRRAARAVPSPRMPWDWQLSLRSTLHYVLAFNLVFLLQELALVIPKAFVPGLRPTLYHNNHSWDGSHPLASLLQGGGALATLLAAAGWLGVLRRDSPRSANAQLLLLWLVYCGFLMALPQFAIGALHPGSDVGMAMAYLQWSPATRVLVALAALAAVPVVAMALLRPLLALAGPGRAASPGARTRFVFQAATLPALLGTVLVIPFRVPREWIEVLLLPAWVAVLGVVWLQAGAWRAPADPPTARASGSLATPLAAVVALLLFFQFVLRHGVPFY